MHVVGAVVFVADRKIPVASVQPLAHDIEDFDHRWPRLVASIEEAAARGAKLIVVPEGSVPGYVIGSLPVNVSDLDCAAAHIARIAREHGATIVYGTAHVEDGATYNTGTVVGPDGTILGRAEKQLLWHFDERWFARGRSIEPIDTPLGRLGVLVCADGRVPTIARTLVDRGAEILVVPTAWVTSGRDPAALENMQADLMINVRARENGRPLVAANKVGVERAAVAYCGKSAIIDRHGEFVAQAGQHAEEWLFGEITVGGPTPARSRLRWDFAALPGGESRRQRARVGITADRLDARFERAAQTAALADVDLILCAEDGTPGAVTLRGGVAFARVGDDVLLDPGGLVEPRLAGVDLFVWVVDEPIEERWLVAFARTRAAELRAYVIAIDRLGTGRALAVDPDGAVVCGTFDGLRIAQFVYDRARTSATVVVPRTDVLDGLRAVEALGALRREGFESAL
jgi:predicted amidohydrolase